MGSLAGISGRWVLCVLWKRSLYVGRVRVSQFKPAIGSRFDVEVGGWPRRRSFQRRLSEWGDSEKAGLS
jgi:hypothetical protein